jgi:bla regulator protein BlaR1
MTLALMVYGIVLGSLLAGAAYFLDRGLRALGRPTRWVWALGMSAAASAPLLAHLSGQAPSTTAQAGSFPAELLYEMMAQGAIETHGQSSISVALNQPLGLIWVLSSMLILVAVLWASLRLRRAAREWEMRRVGTEDILVSEGLGPAVLGLIRPKIVLPAWALELGQEKLEMILLHEKEHQKARDPALLTLGLLLAAVTPWNPGLWWMARRLHLAVEGDCDRRVLARGVPPKSYGNLLLEVASGARGLSALAPALAEGGHTFLERRLLMIRSTVGKHRFGAAALATLVSGGLLVLACETPTPPAPLEDEITFETPPVVMELAAAELAEVEEGYFLVRKTGEGVEFIGSVSPDQLKLIREDSNEADTTYLVKANETRGSVIRLREVADGTAGPKPLIIVDGVIMSDPDAIANLAPADIEKIEVIKGAAAEALYGERAAGGVIQITLKH